MTCQWHSPDTRVRETGLTIGCLNELLQPRLWDEGLWNSRCDGWLYWPPTAPLKCIHYTFSDTASHFEVVNLARYHWTIFNFSVFTTKLKRDCRLINGLVDSGLVSITSHSNMLPYATNFSLACPMGRCAANPVVSLCIDSRMIRPMVI